MSGSPFSEEPLDAPAFDGAGYFPAYPGLKLHDGQYEVVRKLGFGPRSSVWLVILTVHATQQESCELEVLQAINKAHLSVGYSLPSMSDHFTAHSAHGAHLCIGLGVLGTSLEDLRRASPTKRLPVHVVQKAIASVMEPLLRLHSLAVIHGAVTGDNICFVADQTKDDIERMLARIPPCTIEKNVVIDGVKYPVVRSQPLPHGYEWNEAQDVLADSVMYLSNVGHAQMTKAKREKRPPTWEKSGMDDTLRPPEVILKTSYGTKADIWMLGCVVYQLLTGESLVPLEKARDDGDQLAWVQAMAGDRIKREVALASPVRGCFFTADGFFVKEIPVDTLESRLRAGAMRDSMPEEVRGTVDFIQQCLTLDLGDRFTVSGLWDHAWLKPGFACSCGFCGY